MKIYNILGSFGSDKKFEIRRSVILRLIFWDSFSYSWGVANILLTFRLRS